MRNWVLQARTIFVESSAFFGASVLMDPAGSRCGQGPDVSDFIRRALLYGVCGVDHGLRVPITSRPRPW